MCVGKALTGGYLTLAAVLCTARGRARALGARSPGVLMHGPTYMGNPLACAVALASLDLLESAGLAGRRRPGSTPGSAAGLAPLRDLPGVADVRTHRRGGRGPARPPGRRGQGHRGGASRRACGCGRSATSIYTMPPYVTTDEDVARHLRRDRARRWRWHDALGGLAAPSRPRSASAAGLRRDRCDPRGGGRARPIDLAGNDYLGLSRDPAVVARRRGGRARWGAGAGASRLVTGTLRAARRARARRSRRTSASRPRWCSRPATTPTSRSSPRWATATRSSSPTPTCTPRSSTPSGCRGPSVDDRAAQRRGRGRSRARPRPATRRALVLVESVYSVLGDEAPLVELAAVCERHDALLVVDEAHGLGVAAGGGAGRASSAWPGCPHVLVTATLSKALGSQGGAVLGPPAVVDHLVNRARPFIFDTGLAPAAAGAALAALRRAARRARAGRRSCDARIADLAAALGVAPAAGAVLSVPMPSPRVALAAQATALGAGRPGRLLPAAVGARRDLPAADHRQRRHRGRRLGARGRRARGGRQGVTMSTTSRSRAARGDPMSGRGRDRHLHRGRQDRRDRRAGRGPPTGSVVVVKPVQTGALDGDSDADEVAPADRRARSRSSPRSTSRSPPTPPPGGRGSRSRPWRSTPTGSGCSPSHDTVIVEGAGGLLVRLDTDGGTLLDLAARARRAVPVEVVVVVARRARHAQPHRADGGRAARPRARAGAAWWSAPGRPSRGWPSGATSRTCRATGVPLLAVIPEGAGALDRDASRPARPAGSPEPRPG